MSLTIDYVIGVVDVVDYVIGAIFCFTVYESLRSVIKFYPSLQNR